jgi:hypothetical protein
VIALFLLSGLACASAGAVPPGVKLRAPEAQLDERDFVAIASLRELDPAVRAEVFRRAGGEPMAEVGERFQSTDVVMEKLPSRRFVVGGRERGTGGLWILCYEHGGIAYHYHVGLLRRKGDAFEVVRSGQWVPKPKDMQDSITLEKVLRAVKSNELLDDGHW